MANTTKTSNRTFGFRRSPLFRVLQVLPTPVRPWLMAYDALSEVRYRFNERRHGRREASLRSQLTTAKAQRGISLRTLVIGAGLAYVAAKLLPTATAAPRLRISGFVDDALVGVKGQLDRVQEAVNDGFTQARARVSAGREESES